MSKVTQLVLLIDRDSSTTLPVTVFEFEKPILEELYGEDLISVHEEKEVDLAEFDPEAAYDGLKSKYSRSVEGSAAIKRIYPSLSAFKKAAPPATSASPKGSDDGDMSGKTVAEIKASIHSLSDDELIKLEIEEKAKDKPRAGVLDAIDAEMERRDAQ